MQNRQKVINLLGLAQRAGKLATGTETVLDQLNRGKIKAVVMASDIQDNTAEKVNRVAKKGNVPIITSFTAEEISHALSKKRKVLGLTDIGFTKTLIKRIDKGV